MEYRLLGRTGISVSAFSLGAMAFGAIGNTDHDECVHIVHTALDAGINTVDTADIYSRGESEEIVGKALAGRRDDVVLATKCYWPMGGDPNQRGLSRRWISVTLLANLVRKVASSTAVSPPPMTPTCLPRYRAPSQVAQVPSPWPM